MVRRENAHGGPQKGAKPGRGFENRIIPQTAPGRHPAVWPAARRAVARIGRTASADFGQPARRGGYNSAHVRSPLRPSSRSLRILDCRRHRAHDDIVKAAAADGQGALALTDLGNAFGLVRFYQEAAARHQADRRLRRLDRQSGRPRQTVAAAAARQDKVGLNLCELLSKAWLTNQYRGRAELDASWLDGELSKGLLALSGAQQGDIGALAAGNENRAPSRRALGRCSRAASTSELQRYGQPGAEAHPAGRDARPRAEAAGRRDAPDAVHDRRRFHRARGARVYLGRRHPREPAAPEAFHDRPVFPHAGRHGRAVRRPAVGDREHGRNREALQPEARPASRNCRCSRRRTACRSTTLLVQLSKEGRDPSRAAVSGRGRARRAA